MLTGGGTGGHFYPLIAIAEKLIDIGDNNKIIDLKLYYMADNPYDSRVLYEHNITFIKVPTGKLRLYFSIKNFLDPFKTMFGAFVGFVNMFFIYPDVVISKGGYAAFPAVFAAKLLRIPIIVHESDSFPGKMNLWASKFAKYVAISWPEAINYLPKEKTALTGQPIRKSILRGNPEGAYDFFKFKKDLPVILVIGGSQGAEKINNIVIESLPELLKNYQIIHQTGHKNIEEVRLRSKLFLNLNKDLSERYFATPYLNDLHTRMAAGISNLVISRAGSAIFEIASWGIPSIIIPITNSNGDHQRKNAFNYARSGACNVIEESNLTKNLFASEVTKLINNKDRTDSMKKNASNFANHDAAMKIAEMAINIGLTHEQK
jgi:UDP-N-acetylglucosamine--N-acetylmuramyl-(pentapeptide) pyrophosphoryl-undecaprenol N-acetylglucosamine transferase